MNRKLDEDMKQKNHRYSTFAWFSPFLLPKLKQLVQYIVVADSYDTLYCICAIMKDKLLTKKTKQDNCVYCGKKDILTEDHVIPQCLFANGIPGDAPKVWACTYCNGVVKSGLDTYMRDLLVTDMHTSQSPIAQKLFSKFGRAVGRNQSKFANDILQRKQLVELRTQSGFYYGQAYTSPEANAKTFDILSMYVRGLYAYYYHKLLPQDIEFDFVRMGISEKLNDIIRQLRNAGGIASIGDGTVFQCAYGHTVDIPEAGIWVLNFIQRGLFVVFVTPKSVDQSKQFKMTP